MRSLARSIDVVAVDPERERAGIMRAMDVVAFVWAEATEIGDTRKADRANEVLLECVRQLEALLPPPPSRPSLAPRPMPLRRGHHGQHRRAPRRAVRRVARVGVLRGGSDDGGGDDDDPEPRWAHHAHGEDTVSLRVPDLTAIAHFRGEYMDRANDDPKAHDYDDLLAVASIEGPLSPRQVYYQCVSHYPNVVSRSKSEVDRVERSLLSLREEARVDDEKIVDRGRSKHHRRDRTVENAQRESLEKIAGNYRTIAEMGASPDLKPS